MMGSVPLKEKEDTPEGLVSLSFSLSVIGPHSVKTAIPELGRELSPEK